MDRNIALDILKISLSIIIVAFHGKFLSDVSPWGYYFTYNGLFRIAVPIFLIINGFFFYQVQTNGNTIFWLKRIFYLYLFWMSFYSYFWIPSGISINEIGRFIYTLIIGYHHLWYISGMIGAAILLIIILKFKTKTLIPAIALTFFSGVIIQYTGNYHIFDSEILDKISNYGSIHRSFLFFSFPFFCIGFSIRKHKIYQSLSFNFVILLILIGTVLLIIESYINYENSSKGEAFDNLLSLIVLCPAIFLLFMKFNVQGNSKKISLYANGIYFIHPLFITLFHTSTKISNTTLTFATILLSFVTSYFFIKINKKLKFIL